MSLLNIESSNNNLIIKLCQRIDTNNIHHVASEIKEALSKIRASSIILDAEKLEYISSIGLREILDIKKILINVERIIVESKKNECKLKIINVSPRIYDIFEVTGFTDIIQIEKAHRNISIEGCAEIGRGACGTVYRLDDETIVKVFVDGYEMEKIEKERENSKNAFTHGVDTAIPFDIVKVGNNYGLIYEIIKADTLKNVMLKERDKLDYYIGIYANYVKNMHSIVFDKDCYPDMKEVWTKKVEESEGDFSDEERAAAKKLISMIPNRKNFNHGDMNLGNLMVENGNAILIDMEDAVLGHPVFDTSFIYYLLKLLPGFLPEEFCEMIVGFTKKENELLWNRFCEIYFGCKTSEEREAYEKELHPYGIIKLLDVLPLYYKVFDAAEGENKKFVPALYAAFRPAVEKYKKELIEIAEADSVVLNF